MRDTFVKALSRLASEDPRIMLVTGGLGFGVLDGFASDHPKQYLNAGVAEQNMTGVATGMALDGRIVFTYSIANFPVLRCLEQIRNDAAYHDADVKIVSIGAGFSYGALGMSHHATEDLSVMRAIPQITVASPGCLWEVEELTVALAHTPGTAYLRLDKSNAGRTNRAGEVFKLGFSRILRDGDDFALIATGGILAVALQAADRLTDVGIECRVISVPVLRPFDSSLVLDAAERTGGIVTVEEHVVDGGLGGLIAETCLERGVVPQRFYRIGLRSGFSTIVGSQDYLRRQYAMDADSITHKVIELAGSTARSPHLERVASR